MGFGDASLANLRAVLQEGSIINSNLIGTNQIAYKGTNHQYGGSGAVESGNLQFPDQSLVTDYTSIDFSQGGLQDTGESTHFGIQGEGFFLLQQIQDVGVNQPNLLGRDGSFKFSRIPALGGDVLTTANGLVALRDSSGSGAGPFVPITKADLDNGLLPSVVKPDSGSSSLKFSNKGNSVFEFTGAVTNADGIVKQGAVEAANVDIYESLIAMSLNQKKFSAMATQLKADQSSMDVVLGLFNKIS